MFIWNIKRVGFLGRKKPKKTKNDVSQFWSSVLNFFDFSAHPHVFLAPNFLSVMSKLLYVLLKITITWNILLRDIVLKTPLSLSRVIFDDTISKHPSAQKCHVLLERSHICQRLKQNTFVSMAFKKRLPFKERHSKFMNLQNRCLSVSLRNRHS